MPKMIFAYPKSMENPEHGGHIEDFFNLAVVVPTKSHPKYTELEKKTKEMDDKMMGYGKVELQVHTVDVYDVPSGGRRRTRRTQRK
jgi:hypothetical protein